MKQEEIIQIIEGLEYLYSLVNQFKGMIDNGKTTIVRNTQINLTSDQINKANEIIFRTISTIVAIEPEDEVQEQVITPLTRE